jgi:hypothetical protein
MLLRLFEKFLYFFTKVGNFVEDFLFFVESSFFAYLLPPSPHPPPSTVILDLIIFCLVVLTNKVKWVFPQSPEKW